MGATVLWASCRDNWSSVLKLAEEFQFRDGSYQPLTEDAFLAALKGKHSLWQIHGYNSDEAAVKTAYAEQYVQLDKVGLLASGFYDVVVNVLWPGGDWSVSYPFAVKRATLSGTLLGALWGRLDDAQDDVTKIDVVTHSLGARVGLEAIERCIAPLLNATLLAPAVDDESVCDTVLAEFREAVMQLSGKLYIYSSKRDPVLRDAYPKGERVAEVLHLTSDDGEIDQALGFCGPDPQYPESENSVWVDCTRLIAGHSDYRKVPEVFQAWKRLFDPKVLDTKILL